MTYQSIAKEFIQRIKDSGVKILICPSPHRGKGAAIEYTDYETAAYYRKWLESGKDLERYAEHQEAGFPLFDGKSREPQVNNLEYLTYERFGKLWDVLVDSRPMNEDASLVIMKLNKNAQSGKIKFPFSKMLV